MQAEAAESRHPRNAEDGPDATILVVEDSPVQTELLRRALEGAGYKVIAAGDGAEGLALAKANHPAAVVSDINMPHMDGYQMCHAIRGDAELTHTPVILLTMLSDPVDVIRGLNAGADAYLTKPYNIPSLIARLEALLAFPPAPPPPVERRKIEVRLDGQTYSVDAHGPRMLNLLVSTYENAVLQNRELAATQSALENLNQHLELRVAEQTAALKVSEQRFRSLIEHASDLVVVVDASGRITYISPSIRQIGGYEPDELTASNYIEFAHPEDAPAAAASYAELTRNPGMTHKTEFRFRRKDGRWAVLESSSRNAILDPAVAGIVVNARDITERKLAEVALARLNRALRTLSAGNIALVHAVDEQQLIEEMCRILVKTGGYLLAWVGSVERDERKSVRPIAHHIQGNDYVERNLVTWSADASGQGPSGTAIRTMKPHIVQDVRTDPGYAPWRDNAIQLGCTAVASFPLFDEGESVMYVLCVYSSASFSQDESALLAELAGDLAFGIRSLRARTAHELSVQRLNRSMEGTIQAMAATLEMRDAYTAGHQRRVSELVIAIAGALCLPKEDVRAFGLAAIVHDLGKIQVPAEILSKPGKLQPIEFELVKSHPQAGYNILKDVDFPWPIAEIVRQHHERLDGSGYPRGLKGEAMLVGAKILGVADTVEAMTSHRPYRAGLGIDKALAEIEQGSGRLYDAAVVDACVRLFREKQFAFSA
ncbi:MAG: response regulator [Burkholderiales bacterium]|nr:response regulator [Burkholderiales bacterium]